MITLDISDSYIKLLVVKGRAVEQAFSQSIEPGLIKDGVVADTAAVADIVRGMFTANRIGERKIDLSISGLHSLYRIVTLPSVSSKLLEEAVRRETERLIPVSLEDVYLFWRTLSSSRVDIVVSILTVPRQTIDSVMAMLKKAGLSVKFMTVRPLALAQLSNEDTAIVVNVHPLGFDIAVVVDGIPGLLRSINFAGIETPLEQKVTEVTDEMERTISFYNSDEAHVSLPGTVTTFVTGELGAMVSNSLHSQVKSLPRLLSYPADFDDYRYGANLGLAHLSLIASSEAQRLVINIIPSSYIPKVRIGAIASMGFLALCVILLGFFGYMTYGEVAKTFSLRSQVSATKAQVTQSQQQAKAIKDLEKQRDEVKVQFDRLSTPVTSTRAQREKLYGDLASVTRLLPGLITVKSIECGKSIVITGTANEKDIILTYTRQIRDTGRFTTVLVPNMTQNEENTWDFTVNLE